MKELTQNQTYHGFRLIRTEAIPSIHGTGYLFSHEKSGARLVYLANEDENKVFNVAFKTPPENDCGVPHILEHSVLCGSRKYESKDPFNELAKGSLNTFLNAMTYADKTMYPVASCNEEDFHHLMDVYLDAVFFPRIYEKKEIFRQEGWRYTLKDKTAPLEVTGVVYNEMKGALSNPESLLGDAVSRSVFGKSTYGYESGGDPAAIPELTYEAFLDFHRKNYHPSNSYFTLYGNMDIDRCLEHIDGEYLSRFTRSDALPVIEETPWQGREGIVTETYPASEDGEENSYYFSYNRKVGLCTDPERIMALQILSYVLLETNASPLKNALQEKGICEETEGWFDSSAFEMVFSIVAKNAVPEKRDEFVPIIEETLQNIIKNGMPKELLESALRKYEFLLREEDYGSTPKGLIYSARMMKSWLHGKDPFACLDLLHILEKLKQESKNGYFEALLNRLFFADDHKTVLIFVPEKGKNKQIEEAFRNKLAEKKAAMTDAELEELLEDNRKLDIFQKTEDSPEIQAQIPLLELSDISREPRITEYEEMTAGGEIRTLYVPVQSNGIVYIKLHFDISCLPDELIPYAGLLTELYGNLDTQRYDFRTLPTATNRCFGGFTMVNSVYNQDADHYRAFVTAKGKLLKEDLKEAFSLMQEILFRTKTDCVDSMKKIIKSARITGENYLMNASHSVAVGYCGSNIFQGMRTDDMTSGIRFYRFLCDTDAQLEKDPKPVAEQLKKTAELLFTKENLEIAFAAEREDLPLVKQALDEFVSVLPSKPQEKAEARKPHALEETKAAFTCAGGVSYNTVSVDYRKAGFVYTGKYQVLRTIINLEYLWNQVRVQGGAYGCGCNFLLSGCGYFYSYRDPNVTKTYDIYEKLWKDVSAFEASDREMTKYILGTINRQEQPKTSVDRLNDIIGRVYKNVTEDDLRKERADILETTAQDIRDCAALIQTVSKITNACTIGSDRKIKEESEFFDDIKPLL